MEQIEYKTILTKTSGYLDAGFTHTLNAYVGCAYASAVCGEACYAKHNGFITKGRPWGLYGGKKNVREAYRRDYDCLKRPQRGVPKPLRIFMSSVTDPYVPQELTVRNTESILEEMLNRPPDGLVIQTHTHLVERDIDLIVELSRLCSVWLSITVETDLEVLPGFPKHATPIAKRLETFGKFRARGVPTQAAVAPLLPIGDVVGFAKLLHQLCDRVVVDHYLLGDGSKGLRTKRTNFPPLLAAAGYGEWNTLEKFWEAVETFRTVLGEDRTLVSEFGFNKE